jgi:UPF0755 protein
MKKLLIFLLIIVLVLAGVGAWMVLGPATSFDTPVKALYIRSDAANKKAVLDSLRKNSIISNEWAFDQLANRFDYWKNIRPGKYEFKKGTSLLTIVRTLRNGQQTPVNLTITKVRTREDLAKMVGRKFETDSAGMIRFLNTADSLKQYGAEPETAMWQILPDTYTYFWNSDPSRIYTKFSEASKKFWTEEKKKQAAALGLTPLQAYILASIVEEETNHNEEKDTIASVYLNRMQKGMPLGADPTLKFAIRDFTITWIHGDMLKTVSPYNTYVNKGLPPGPICTPSRRTIEEVLKAPTTNYLYFVANSNFSQTHLFSETFAEHLKKAEAFQAEDKRRREAREKQNSR